MSPLVGGILLFAGMFVLIFLGVHVGVALGISGAVFLYIFFGGFSTLTAVATKTYGALDSYVLIAVPLFLLMAEALVREGIARDIFDAASRWTTFLRGGIAHATILACAVFAAMCGSSTAGVAAFGTSATPEMERLNYPKDIAYGTVATGATLGILIPPSIPFIIYGMMTGQSIGQLFIAGVVPGIVMTILLMLYVAFETIRRPHEMPKPAPSTWRERFASLPLVVPALILIVLVLGTIYLGVATATEAAGVGAAGTLLIGLALRRLNWRTLGDILMRTAQNNCMILILFTGAMVFGYALTLLQMPQVVTEFVVSMGLGPWGIMIAINILLIILGCFMEATSIMVILTPILYPTIVALGFDPIWFGVIFIINIQLGLLTPPFGMNLFVLSGLRQIPIGLLYRIIIPWCGVLLVGLIIVLAFPQLSLWLPSLMIKKG